MGIDINQCLDKYLVLYHIVSNTLVDSIEDFFLAYATINFKHPQTGAMKAAPVGFSWTTLLFSFFPALLRGHWVGAVIIFAISLMTAGLAVIVFAFIYNKMYIKYLISEGFKVENASQDSEFLAGKLQISLPMAGS